MGPVHCNHTAHRSVHASGPIKDGSWLNHLGHCRKALGWLLTMKSSWFNEAGGGAENTTDDNESAEGAEK